MDLRPTDGHQKRAMNSTCIQLGGVVVWKVLHDEVLSGTKISSQWERRFASGPNDSFEIFAVLVIRFSSKDRTKALLYDGPLFNAAGRIHQSLAGDKIACPTKRPAATKTTALTRGWQAEASTPPKIVASCEEFEL